MSRPYRGEQTILNIARMRYEQGLTQSEIASDLEVSVATVSRHLKKAMDVGIVEIRVAARAYRDFELERKLARKFNLESAIVVESQPDHNATLQLLGRAAATALREFLTDGSIVGVSNGETVAAVAESMRKSRSSEINVVTLIGSVGGAEEPSQTGQICRMLASNTGGKAWILPLPAVVESRKLAASFRKTQPYTEVFSLVEKLSVTLVGVGPMIQETSAFKLGHFSKELWDEVLDNKAVGTICGRFFDINGSVVTTDIDARTISVSLDHLAAVPKKIGVAVGSEKSMAIKAAMQGRLINILGTDSHTAEVLLES